MAQVMPLHSIEEAFFKSVKKQRTLGEKSKRVEKDFCSRRPRPSLMVLLKNDPTIVIGQLT